MQPEIFDKYSLYFSAAVLVFSLLLFFYLSGVFLSSLGAAFLAALLGWITYAIMRWLFLALKK